MKHLVLVGGGHAHLHVVEAVAEGRRTGSGWTDVTVSLLSPSPHHHYSGMLPGYLQGRYTEAALRFDLPALCQAAGIRFVQGTAQRIELLDQEVPKTAAVSGTGGDPSDDAENGAPSHPGMGPSDFVIRGRIHTDAEVIPFSAASLDVGSVIGGREIPGVRRHAWALRPISRAVELEGVLAALARGETALVPGGGMGPGRASPVVVVGAGAAGFEVALAAAERLASGSAPLDVTLVEAGPELLPEFSQRVRRRALSVLTRRGVKLRTGCRVREVAADRVQVEEDAGGVQRTSSLPAALTLWVAGAGPPELLARSDLPLGEEGFFQVDAHLRSVDGAPVWGAGDCISLRGFPWMPKAGVYAVRQAPVLAANLRSALEGEEGEEAERYRPQSSFLSLLNTGQGEALLRWKFLVAHGRWPWWLKDWIDRRFMERYHGLASEGGFGGS
jgi:NADH dehydrogenase FAD-containing subunit